MKENFRTRRNSQRVSDIQAGKMGGPDAITPVDISRSTDVDEDDVADVLSYLISEGWMLGRYVNLEPRTESEEEEL